MLDYESALTRELSIPNFARTKESGDKGFYCTSA